MVRRILFTVLWSIGVFVVMQFLFGFLVGSLVFNLVMADSDGEINEAFIIGFVTVTFILNLALTAAAAMLGGMGRLPGTRFERTNDAA